MLVSHRRRPTFRRGYTLVDVTLTVFIIGIFASIATPRYGQMISRFRAEAAARRVAADLQMARHHAKLRGTTQQVQFDPVDHVYELTGMQDVDHPEDPYVVDLREIGYGATFGSVAFGSSGSKRSVVFDIYGRPNHGGSVTIQVDGHQRSVSVDEITGAIEIP